MSYEENNLQEGCGNRLSRASWRLLPLLIAAMTCAVCLPSVASASNCSAQLGFPIIPALYSNSIVNVIVPISATCLVPYGNQVNATATAYDLNTNTLTSTVNTILTSVDGGYTFTGQLGFNLPASTQGHWMQIAVTVFNPQSNGQLTTTGEAFPINTGTVQVVTTTVTANQFAPTLPTQRVDLFVYVAIAAILATVIIVTVGLIVYSRRPAANYLQPRAY